MRLDLLDDLRYCAQTDITDIVPQQSEKGVLKRA
jgi:phosphosulfolactate phosphohydrolase-like enzyme